MVRGHAARVPRAGDFPRVVAVLPGHYVFKFHMVIVLMLAGGP